MKIGTKPYARSQRNELTEVTGRWAEDSADRRPDTGPDAGGNRSDAGQQRPIEYREVPERRHCDRTCPVACDRTLAASDQLIAALTVGTIGRVW